jgi:hypothetical protein
MAQTVDSILKKQREYLAYTGGVFALREADETYNDFNRDIIAAFKEAHGTAFLGNINFYGEKRQKVADGSASVYEEYIGQLVYNFGADFVVADKDELLESMIRTWNGGHTHSDKRNLIAQITDRIAELGGLCFIWY